MTRARRRIDRSQWDVGQIVQESDEQAEVNGEPGAPLDSEQLPV